MKDNLPSQGVESLYQEVKQVIEEEETPFTEQLILQWFKPIGT
jgi:hypothetical protein